MSRGSVTAPWRVRGGPEREFWPGELEWWFGGGGKARRGMPRRTAAIPIALPMCDARWSAGREKRGKAERVR